MGLLAPEKVTATAREERKYNFERFVQLHQGDARTKRNFYCVCNTGLHDTYAPDHFVGYEGSDCVLDLGMDGEIILFPTKMEAKAYAAELEPILRKYHMGVRCKVLKVACRITTVTLYAPTHPEYSFDTPKYIITIRF